MADVTVTAANVKVISGTPKTGKAGASLTAGQTIYQDPTDSSWKPAKADASVTSNATAIALNSCSTGQTFSLIDNGVIAAGGTIVAGKPYVVSAATAGGLAPVADLTSGNYAVYVGVGASTANLTLAFNNTGLALA